MQRCKHVFTLIELLVVIAIIAILAAILFPVFAQARDKARQVACLSNAKQMGTAAMMYAQDYDEQLMEIYRCQNGVPRPGGGGCLSGAMTDWWPSTPNANINNPATGQPFGWFTGPQSGRAQFSPNWAYVLFPYTKNSMILDCPSGAPIWLAKTRTDSASFIYNNWLADQGVSATPARTLAEVPRPADLILMFETGKACRVVEFQGWRGVHNFGLTTGLCTDVALNHPIEDLRPNAPIGDCPRCYSDWVPKHAGGRNMIYLDGHAKWSKDGNLYVRNHRQNWIPQCQQ